MNITKLQWWLPKILCLIAACAFWAYVMNEQDPQVESTYIVPVEVKNLDRSLVAINVPTEIQVVVRMSRSQMIKTRSDDIKAYVDLSEVASGNYANIPIQVVLPASDETVVSMTPQTFTLTVEPYAVKSIPVITDFFGTPSSSFSPSIGSVSPDTVTIAGAQSKVSIAEKAIVSINITGRNADFYEYDNIGIVDADGKTITGLDIMPAQVQVSVKITEEQKTGNIPIKVVTTGTVAEGHAIKKISARPSMVTVTAPISFFSKNHEIKLSAIDLSGMDTSIVKTVEIPTPDNGIVTPATVDVTIEIADNN